MRKRIGGEAAIRIYHEVILRGITKSDEDTPAERAYREKIVKQVREIEEAGGAAEPISEL